MSVSLQEVIEAAGYDLYTYQDSLWLFSKQAEFGELLDKAEKIIEEHED